MVALADESTTEDGRTETETPFAVILITVVYSTSSEGVSELVLGSHKENACSSKIMSEAKERQHIQQIQLQCQGGLQDSISVTSSIGGMLRVRNKHNHGAQGSGVRFLGFHSGSLTY